MVCTTVLESAEIPFAVDVFWTMCSQTMLRGINFVQMLRAR